MIQKYKAATDKIIIFCCYKFQDGIYFGHNVIWIVATIQLFVASQQLGCHACAAQSGECTNDCCFATTRKATFFIMPHKITTAHGLGIAAVSFFILLKKSNYFFTGQKRINQTCSIKKIQAHSPNTNATLLNKC
jgi:hypothetical protein